MKSGFVGLVGLPNAGKSSLLNALVEEKLSIVTAKPQTTRRRILGILNSENSQFVFVDSPGIIRGEHYAQKGLNNFLEQEAQDVIRSSDALVGVLNIDESEPENLKEILNLIKAGKKPSLFVINKSDLVEFQRRIPLIKDMIESVFPNSIVLETSSKSKLEDQLKKKFLQDLAELLPDSDEPLYGEDLYTPHTTRELVAEIIREKCFEVLHQEVPYQMAVQVIKFDESNPDLPRIFVDLWVNRESHKPIVIGKGATNLKEIGTRSRTEIEKFMGVPKVFLSLNVIVKENWATSAHSMKELGYVIKN